jgi:outer membrane lipoprotein carrier protein
MKKLCLAVLFLSVFSAGISAETKSKIDEILLNMENADANIKTVRFNIYQEINYTLTKEKQIVEGEIAFKKPENFYFKQTKPMEQIINANGRKIWIYTPAYNQLMVDSWKNWLKNGFVPSSLLSFSNDWKEMKNNYTFEYLGDEDNCFIIGLTPSKESAASSWKMNIWIDSKLFVPKKVKLFAENIEITTNTSEYVVNGKIDDSLFHFKIPKGVEPVKMNQ